MTVSCFTCFKCFLVSLYLCVIVYNIWFASIVYQVTQTNEKNVLSSSEKEKNMSHLMQYIFIATYAYIGVVFVVLESYKLIVCYIVSQLLLALGFILSDAGNRFSGPLSCIALLCIAIVYLLRYRNSRQQSLDYIEVPSRTHKSTLLHVLLIILYMMSIVCLILFTQDELVEMDSDFYRGDDNNTSNSDANNLRRELVSKCGYFLTGIVGVFFATALCNLCIQREDVLQNLAMLLAMLLLSFVVGNSIYVYNILLIAFFTVVTAVYGQSVSNATHRYEKCKQQNDLLDETSLDDTSGSMSSRKTRQTRSKVLTPGDCA